MQTNFKTESEPQVRCDDGLARDRSKEIYISIRIEWLRKTVADVQGPALPEDMAARDGILEALKAQGYEVLATGEGKYADAWVKRANAAGELRLPDSDAGKEAK